MLSAFIQIQIFFHQNVNRLRSCILYREKQQQILGQEMSKLHTVCYLFFLSSHCLNLDISCSATGLTMLDLNI